MALPLARPGIISVIVFSFTLTLHEFIYALVFIQRSQWRTLSVGVPSELILDDVFFWQPLLASALIIAIPVGLVYNLFLDRLIQGFTAGAVKEWTACRGVRGRARYLSEHLGYATTFDYAFYRWFTDSPLP